MNLLAAACITWTLTTPCGDDVIRWIDPVPDPPQSFTIRLVYDGNTIEVPQGVEVHPIGCYDGTVRVTTVNSEGTESEEPFFFRWEGVAGADTLGAEATGRMMEWEHPVGIGRFDDFRCGGEVPPPPPETVLCAEPDELGECRCCQ